MLDISVIDGYIFPKGINELKLHRFIDLMDIDNNKPEFLNEIQAIKSPNKRSKALETLNNKDEILYVKYMKEIICCLGGKGKKDKETKEYLPDYLTGKIPMKVLDELSISTIDALYNIVYPNALVNLSKIKKKQTHFKFKNKTFQLSTEIFESDQVLNVTYGEWEESSYIRSSFQENFKSDNFWKIYPELMSIVCREVKDGQPIDYHQDNIKTNKKIFLECPMNIVYDVSFFLTKHTSTLVKNMAISEKGRTLAKNLKLITQDASKKQTEG